MRREIALSEISDGRLYGANDMVRADCQDCKGCFACCCGMGSSIVLDPFDIWNLNGHLGKTFHDLLETHMELKVDEGLILPNLKMAGDKSRCSFLTGEGRCSIHPFRPGICRLFPLGRYYEDGTFRYFLQIHECRHENRSKVKVKKWVDIEPMKSYETFICRWHYFLLDLQKALSGCEDANERKGMNLYILNHFYVEPFGREADFYREAEERICLAKEALGL